MPKNIGERLQNYRKSKKLKVIDFAGLVGISQGTLSGLENNKSKPSTDTLASLVRNTDINIEWLLTGENIVNQAPCDADPEVALLLEGARRVLKSDNPIAFEALKHNIKYFDHTVKTEKRLVESELRQQKSEERQKELEDKLENIMDLVMNQQGDEQKKQAKQTIKLGKKKDNDRKTP